MRIRPGDTSPRWTWSQRSVPWRVQPGVTPRLTTAETVEASPLALPHGFRPGPGFDLARLGPVDAVGGGAGRRVILTASLMCPPDPSNQHGDASTRRDGAAGGGRFIATSWTAVAAASRPGSVEAQEALSRLCELYWPPVFAYLRRTGVPEEEAKDLTQEFFLRMMSRNAFAAADRTKGKFRTFLLTALKFFLANERDRARAAKRGGGRETLSLDREPAEGEASIEPATLDSPAMAYEESWARTVFTRAEQLVGDEYQSVGKAGLFAGLKEFLERGPESGGYQSVAARLGMTPNAVGVAVHRMRHRFGELIRAEVARTLCDPTAEEVQGEIRYLMELLARDRA